jgi:hypothetical protein
MARRRRQIMQNFPAWWQSSWVSLTRRGDRSPVPAPASNEGSGKAVYLKKEEEASNNVEFSLGSVQFYL